MKRLRAFLDEHYEQEAQVLLCGDFNVAPEERDVHDRKVGGAHTLQQRERAALNEIKDWGFVDAFRLHTTKAAIFLVGLPARIVSPQRRTAHRPTSGRRKNTGGALSTIMDRQRAARVGSALGSHAGSSRVQVILDFRFRFWIGCCFSLKLDFEKLTFITRLIQNPKSKIQNG